MHHTYNKFVIFSAALHISCTNLIFVEPGQKSAGSTVETCWCRVCEQKGTCATVDLLCRETLTRHVANQQSWPISSGLQQLSSWGMVQEVGRLKFIWTSLWCWNLTVLSTGKVAGRFYDSTGAATAVLLAAQSSINHALSAKQRDDERQRIFPPCNSRWSDAEGSTVWCSTKRWHHRHCQYRVFQ